MKDKKVELLAPAGSYESFLGAVHAGADAVYLGGEKFSARAYANNFSTEELCRAIRYAHLSGRKVYLTLNTLVKESEFSGMKAYLTPFYEEGLDGIIIQDMGVFSYVREHFPLLPLHISTQAMITGTEGAAFFKSQGAVRIVPARELSLEEIKTIKRETKLELETFIHGAMCYCYSGQCLFSSIAGGRSGNRGRCAQPCRLPYRMRVEGKQYFTKESYPLSLKDLCTVEYIPALIRAGIDSFKIEGRMKKPEYAAGVTSIYRKYIDAFYEYGDKERPVEPEDLKKLSSIYIRSGVESGYYFRHNGSEMITLSSPAYSGNDESVLEEVREAFLMAEEKTEITAAVYGRIGKPLSLTLYCRNQEVTVNGPVVEASLKQPVEHSVLKERICRFGNTFFEVKECRIQADENIFVPLKAINELRREAAALLEDAILKQKNDTVKNNFAGKTKKAEILKEKKKSAVKEPAGFCVFVSTPEQWEACRKKFNALRRIYMDSDLYLKMAQDTKRCMELSECRNKTPLFAALPFVAGKRDEVYFEKLWEQIKKEPIAGFLVRNFEELGWLAKRKSSGLPAAFDAGMYGFNESAVRFFGSVEGICPDTVCLPYELNLREKKQLMKQTPDVLYEQVVYGRIPMMVTANCVLKTAGRCQDGITKTVTLTDRYRHDFPVETVCSHCYNVIWNCLPVSLHKSLQEYEGCLKRLQFTTETAAQTEQILDFFMDGGAEESEPDFAYTTGHEKRGVE